jgi:hypothetical protein
MAEASNGPGSRRRRQALNRLTEEAGELGLYDGSPDDYAAALRSARRRRASSTRAVITPRAPQQDQQRATE